MGKSEGYRVSCEERRKKADSINLIVYATETNARYPRTTLACDKARSYRAPKNANDILAKVYENTEDLPRIDKPSIRQDRKGGKSNPRRTYTEKRCTYTEKPPPDECCTFRICLSLDPGKCWFLPPWAGCRRHKFHTKFPPGEKRRRMDTCTDKERNDELSQCQEEENETFRNQNQGLSAITMESSDLYSSCRSVIGILCEQARLSKNNKVESIIRNNIAVMQREVNEELLRQQGGQ